MNQRGFTLIETLVAMVVLAVGLLAIARMSLTYVRANTYNHEMGEATVLAKEKMEELKGFASSERGDRFSVLDFDYFVSTSPCFSSVEDPPGSGTAKTVSGFLSGGLTATGCGVTGRSLSINGGDTLYGVLFDDGAHGDGTSGDGVYGAQDTVNYSAAGTSGFTVARTWTVEPISLGGSTNFARVTVETAWTDRLGATRTIHLESMVYRRQ